MDSLLWYYSVLEISGSEDRLKGFFLPLGNHFKDRMKKVFYEEFQIFLREYNKLSVRSYINNPKYKHTTNLLDIYSNADENLVKLTDIGVEGSASTKTPNNTKDIKDCAYEEVEHGKFLEDYEDVVEEEVEEDSKFEEHGRYLEDYSSEEVVEDLEEDWEESEELEESESIPEEDNLDSDWVEESDWSEETVEGTESDWIEESDLVDEGADSVWVESDEFEGCDSGDDWIEETSDSDWVEEEEIEEEKIEELGSDWVEDSDDWVEEDEVEETSESDWIEEDESDWVEESEIESESDWVEEDDSGDDWIEEDDSDWIEEPEDNIKSTPNTTVRDKQPVKSAPSKSKVPEKDISDYIQDLTNGFLTSSKRAIIKGLRKLDK